LLADILVSLSPDIIARIKPGGKLLISGFMDKPSGPISAYFDWNPVTSSARSADEVAEHFTSHLKLLEKIERKGWVAMAFQK
ncbi:MAG: hypothetical protein JNN15_08335, partial [Blastocatellia bacterium]|nr:hypothetical protein [Blastocatellia bacterium]